MNLKMPHNSLFAILLRSRWWVSLLIAAAVAGVARLALPPAYAGLAVFCALPFLVIAALAGWRQLRQPSPARVQRTLAAVGAMPWPAFADALEAAFRAEGHAVERLPGPAADFRLEGTRRGTTLVSGRRWKAARLGTEPLRALQAAMAADEASSGVCIALGEPSESALAFARESGIEILRGEKLARLLRHAAPGAR